MERGAVRAGSTGKGLLFHYAWLKSVGTVTQISPSFRLSTRSRRCLNCAVHRPRTWTPFALPKKRETVSNASHAIVSWMFRAS